MMTEDEKRRILDETARNLADKAALKRDNARRLAAEPVDMLQRWREQAAELDVREEQGERDLRAEERRMAREARRQARQDPEAWDRWFAECLQRHLPAHLLPVVTAIADSTNALVDQLNDQATKREKLLEQYRVEIRDLKLECAKLGNLVSELRTSHALGAASDALVRSVN